jgi:hypothetical protein
MSWPDSHYHQSSAVLVVHSLLVETALRYLVGIPQQRDCWRAFGHTRMPFTDAHNPIHQGNEAEGKED